MADSRVSVLIDIRSKLAGVEKATAGFGKLIKSVAGFAAAYLSMRGVMRGARDIINLGADLNHLTAQTGIAESSLLTLGQAFKDNGVEASKVGPAVNKMQKAIVDASNGLATYQRAFDALGLSTEELLELSPEQQFERVSKALAQVENPARRSAAAMEIFGRSGAQLMPLFRSGGAIDDARASLGQMPEVLERNSVQFERIDTLLGRLPNKSRQMFAGIGDMVADELLGPLEELNQMDLTEFGQRIGAFIDLAIESFRDGTFAEFIGLSIEVGFEQGTDAAKRMIDETLGWFGAEGQGWSTVLNGVMTFGTRTAETMIDALTTPITWLSAGFRKIGEEVRVIFQTSGNVLSKIFQAVINAITAGFEGLLNGVIERVNSITAALPFTDGTQIGKVEFGRIDWADKVIKPAREFKDLLDDQRDGMEVMTTLIKEQLNENLLRSRDILGLQGEELAEQVRATERMIALIDEHNLKRQRAVASSEGLTPLADAADIDSSSQENATNQLDEELSEAGSAAMDTFSSVDSALRSGLSSSIEGLTMRTRTWRESLVSVATTVRGALVQSFAQMTTNWIADRLRMFVMGESLKQAEASSTVAAEGTKQAAMTPTAMLASIGSYGAAALIGAAVLTAVLASVTGFAEGGYTGFGGKYDPAGIVHKGEFVIPADVVSQQGPAYFDNLVGQLRVKRPSLPSLPGFAEGGMAGAVPTMGPQSSGGGSVNIAVTGTRNDLRRFLETAEGEAVVLDIMSRNKLRLGVPS